MSNANSFKIGRSTLTVLLAIDIAEREVDGRYAITNLMYFGKFLDFSSSIKSLIIDRLEFLAECVAAKLSPKWDDSSPLPYKPFKKKIMRPIVKLDSIQYGLDSYFGRRSPLTWSARLIKMERVVEAFLTRIEDIPFDNEIVFSESETIFIARNCADGLRRDPELTISLIAYLMKLNGSVQN